MDELEELRNEFRKWAELGRMCGSDKTFRAAVKDLYHSEPEDEVRRGYGIDPIAWQGVDACVEILYKAKADFDAVYSWSQKAKS